MHRTKATIASKANTSFAQDAWGNNRWRAPVVSGCRLRSILCRRAPMLSPLHEQVGS